MDELKKQTGLREKKSIKEISCPMTHETYSSLNIGIQHL